MIFFPNAKVNIGLNIVRKREDGFHDLSSLFYPIQLNDIVEIVPSNTFSFTLTGFTEKVSQKDNLCVKAYSTLKKEFNIPSVKIHLHKVIPVGAGLGGGSADAVGVLKLLNQLFELDISFKKLKTLTEHLGSDCPFFVENKPAIISGKGEVMQKTKISLKGKYWVLVYPQIFVSTAEAYSKITPKEEKEPLEEALNQPVKYWKEVVKNDFEKSIAAKYPLIKAIKETFYEEGAFYSSMTGSGSAVFGIFNEEPTKFTIDLPYWTGKFDI